MSNLTCSHPTTIEIQTASRSQIYGLGISVDIVEMPFHESAYRYSRATNTVQNFPQMGLQSKAYNTSSQMVALSATDRNDNGITFCDEVIDNFRIVNQLKFLESQRKLSIARKLIFSRVDDLFSASKVSVIDNFIEQFISKKLSFALHVALLMIIGNIKRHLGDYSNLVVSAQNSADNNQSEKAKKIIDGLI